MADDSNTKVESSSNNGFSIHLLQRDSLQSRFDQSDCPKSKECLESIINSYDYLLELCRVDLSTIYKNKDQLIS